MTSFVTPRPQPATRVLKELRWARYSSSSLLLQEEEELVEVTDPVESRGSSWCLFLFVEPSGFNGVLLQSEERVKEQPRKHRWCEGEKQSQAGWTGNSGQEGVCWGWSHGREQDRNRREEEEDG